MENARKSLDKLEGKTMIEEGHQIVFDAHHAYEKTKVLRMVAKEGTDRNCKFEWQRKMKAWTITLFYETRQFTFPFFTGKAIGEPKLKDVMNCLVADALSVTEWTQNFEEWAQQMGYTWEEWAQARRIYRECQRIARQLKKLFEEDFSAIAEMYR